MNAWAVHGRDRLDILQRTLAPAKSFGPDAPGTQYGVVSEDLEPCAFIQQPASTVQTWRNRQCQQPCAVVVLREKDDLCSRNASQAYPKGKVD